MCNLGARFASLVINTVHEKNVLQLPGVSPLPHMKKDDKKARPEIYRQTKKLGVVMQVQY